jgi:hypothetical protein
LRLLRRLPARQGTTGRLIDGLRSVVVAAVEADGNTLVAVAMVVRVAVVAGTLGMGAVADAAGVRAAVVAAGRDMRGLAQAAAVRPGNKATAVATGRVVSRLATAGVQATTATPGRRRHPAATANPTATAHLTNLVIRSMRRVTRITQPIAATVELARARNISARSKAVGMVDPASQRDAFPLVAELVSNIVLVADGQAGVGNTFE